MALFQKTVEQKYLKQLDAELINRKYLEFKTYFGNSKEWSGSTPSLIRSFSLALNVFQRLSSTTNWYLQRWQQYKKNLQLIHN